MLVKTCRLLSGWNVKWQDSVQLKATVMEVTGVQKTRFLLTHFNWQKYSSAPVGSNAHAKHIWYEFIKICLSIGIFSLKQLLHC